MSDLPRRYEGQTVLAELLSKAGSPYSIDDVKALFEEAIAEKETPSATFPELFEAEPHFASPEVAKRLYGNLFGLWDRIAQGETSEPTPEKPGKPERPGKQVAPPMPEAPAPVSGREIDDAFVEAAFHFIEALPERERQKRFDRFEQRESEYLQALHLLKLSAGAEQVGLDLGFELFVIAELALGERVGRTDFASLRSTQTSKAQPQPALSRYLEEWLAEAMLDEQEPLSAEERARLEPLIRAAAQQLAP